MNRFRRLVTLVSATALAVTCAVLVAPGAYAATASFTKTQDWGSGYEALFTVRNNTATAITSWRVEFDLAVGSTIGSSWDATRTSSGDHHSFGNVSWNGTLAAGASTTFGFTVAGTGTPTNCTVNGTSCAGGGGGGDTQPPTVPGNLRSTSVTSTSVSLAWNAATDNTAVTGYDIYRGGTLATTVTGTSGTVGGLAASTAYSFTVRARDAAGNLSAASNQVSATTAPGGGGGTTPAAINGQLRVCGTKLCNRYGRPIQLRGMSTHGIQWYAQCVNNNSLDALANDWRADVLRISMYIQEDGYETDPRGFTDRVHDYIERATARGLYAIVDWHMLTPGDPNFNLSRARTFFTEIASRHKDKTNILYEVANEPNGVGWPAIKSYAEQIIPVIRAQDPDGVVLVGTRAWSSLGLSDGASETEVVNNPVNATNIMYTFHFYAASHGASYLNALSRAADRIPMFVTEFGTQTASGDGANNFTQAQAYLDLMATKQISWVNWNFSDDFRSGAVFNTGTCNGTTYTGTTVLKPAGIWIRDRTRTPDTFPTT
ncbi:cellulase family glycosylhydrolase [Micromonospora sp. NBC_01699]|uniref:cellulase family glycosylhydrolase n=1 Tax=Micromonospora sp. NBC_01699 TaxID=2975984 RepID=UPI002E2F25F9|nr:cellulase family glycosylhydrolase [Micromonospora sp. NBC_01699]